MADIALLAFGLALFHGTIAVALNVAVNPLLKIPRHFFRTYLSIVLAWLLLQFIVAILLIWPV
jgi:hypothetical protein